MSRQLLLDQLAALATTMKEASEADAVLNMTYWIETAPEKEDNHFCGTAACICGYQALTGRVGIFGLEDSVYKSCLSSDIGTSLSESCREVFGAVGLATSIYEMSREKRFDRARESELFSFNELDSFKHLNSNKTTPQDAYDYLVACIDKVKEYGE